MFKQAIGERVPLLWSFFYFFCLLCGYYMLRPVRDEMAIEGGVQHLPWMMTGTFLTLLVATPGIAATAKKAAIYKAEKFSDHAPLTIDYDFKP